MSFSEYNRDIDRQTRNGYEQWPQVLEAAKQNPSQMWFLMLLSGTYYNTNEGMLNSFIYANTVSLS